MKLIMAVIHREDEHKVITGLQQGNYSATKLCSSGGFLKAGNTTLLIGLEDERVDDAISIIEKYSKSRTRIVNTSIMPDMSINYPYEVEVGGATIFVMNVERFEKV
ncbi:MAG: cyclic-di-AMP receptor [Bacillota bacterium]|nr:cyclic-di-AMP receptor [Bacillota bacterium]